MSDCGFNIGVNELKKIVSQLEPIFSGGIMSDNNVLFVIGEKITAKTINEDAKVAIVFDCEEKKQGSFVVNGKVFASIVKKSVGEKINISTEENFLIVENNACKFKVALSDASEEYFETQKLEDSGKFQINAQDLKTAISAVSCCIDQAKQHINCVMIHSIEEQKGKVFIVATDGMRLGVAERNANYDKEIPELIVPKKASEYILTMIGEEQSEVVIEYTENTIQVSNGFATYTSRLLDTKFPKYRAVIPEANNKVLEVKNTDLQNLITYLTSIAENTFRIKLAISKDAVSLTCDENGNNSSGKIDATYGDSENIEIVCNYRLLQEILKKISSSIVRFQILDATTPLLIRPIDDDSVKYVFMPFVS